METLGKRLQAAAGMWSGHLLTLAITVFLVRMGQGLMTGASTNFFVDVLGLSGKQVLWLAGIREIPGLGLMFIAALIMHLPLSKRAGLSLLVMGVGYGLYVTINSYVALLVIAVVASLGFHNWMPLQNALGMSLARKEESGRVLGMLTAVGSFASIIGMGLIAILATTLPLRAFYAIAGFSMVLGGFLVMRIPAEVGETGRAQPRITLNKRYWIYYVLTFFEGSRMQVFGTFGTLILVQDYGLTAREISLLLLVSSIVNLIVTPRFGAMLDKLGERVTLSFSYVLLALCFVGYASVHNAWFLGAMLVCINLLVTLSIGLSTYVRRIAPPEELTPTLSAGVSINHITSVGMSLLAGALLSIVGYEGLCWGAAAIIMLSVPFALAIKTDLPTATAQPAPAG